MFRTRTHPLIDPALGSAAGVDGKSAVLLVDDESILLEEMSEYLHSEGYPVTLAHDGREALNIFRESPPGRFAVVLSDLRMPGITGFALAKAIMQLTAPDEAAEVIVMTGHASPATYAEAPNGLFAIVQKPVRLSRLAEIVSQAHDAAICRRVAASADIRAGMPSGA